jgi:hypothetical protein
VDFLQSQIDFRPMLVEASGEARMLRDLLLIVVSGAVAAAMPRRSGR